MRSAPEARIHRNKALEGGGWRGVGREEHAVPKVTGGGGKGKEV